MPALLTNSGSTLPITVTRIDMQDQYYLLKDTTRSLPQNYSEGYGIFRSHGAYSDWTWAFANNYSIYASYVKVKSRTALAPGSVSEYCASYEVTAYPIDESVLQALRDQPDEMAYLQQHYPELFI